MKICAAQTRPFKGDIKRNIETHKRMIDAAAANGADLIIFPELSITGYEPDLAKNLAITPDNALLDEFQTLSDSNGMTIAVGMPTKNSGAVSISMFIFQPHTPRKIYSKKYLHSDEEPFFTSGENFPVFKVNKTSIAPVICYELHIPEHSTTASKHGAELYLASVAKTAEGMIRGAQTLSDIARRYKFPVVISNSVGPSDNFIGAGGSAAWSDQGELLEQLGDEEEGLLFFDTNTLETSKAVLV